ncbi:TniQ family protein [Ferrovibrio sp.]|uniref:TniQ family protein n=1 Tax=Ferrovibrio sp. TaxID=1917215 RepID=UPI0035141D3A
MTVATTESAKRLVVRPGIKDVESLHGYLLRCAEANFYPSFHWILNLSGLSAGISTFSDMSALSAVTGVAMEELRRRTYWPPPGKSPAYVSLNGQVLKRQYLELTSARVCSQCLAESPVCRSEWELRFFCACPRHKTRLIDECPACGSSISWNRSRICFCPCGADFRSAGAETVDELLLDLSQTVSSKVFGNPPFRKSDWSDNPLSTLPAVEFMDVVHVLGSFSFDLEGRLVRSEGAGKGIVENLQHLARAAEILGAWPGSFHAFLDRVRDSNKASSEGTGLLKEFGIFYSTVSHKFTRSSLKVIRKEMAKYVHAQWTGGYTTDRNKWLKAARNPVLVSRPRAAKALKVAPQTVDVLLREGELTGQTGPMGFKRTMALIDRASIRAYLDRRRHIVDSGTASRLLGVSKPAYRSLVHDGLLTPNQRIAPRIKKRYEIDKTTIARLLNRLEMAMDTDESGPGINYQRAVVRLRQAGFTPTHLIKAALNGSIPVVGVDDRQAGLRRFHYSGPALQLFLERSAARQRIGALDLFVGSGQYLEARSTA